MNAPLAAEEFVYYVMDREQVEEMTKNVGKRLSEHVHSLHDWLLENFPGLDEKSRRERLMGYRMRTGEQWVALAHTSPRRFGQDWKEYQGLWWLERTGRL